MNAALLTAERVEELFRQCLAATAGQEDASTMQGIVNGAASRPEAIENHKEDIGRLLAELPEPFQESGGGGWSFLNACNDRHGHQWTGLHTTMEHLFMLGLASGQVTELLPRDMWSALPGGMPYYLVKAVVNTADSEIPPITELQDGR